MLLNSGEVKEASTLSTSDQANVSLNGTAPTEKTLSIGTKLVNGLINPSKTVTIIESTRGNSTLADNIADAIPKPDGTAGSGTGSTVKYNPTGTGSFIKNADGTTV